MVGAARYRRGSGRSDGDGAARFGRRQHKHSFRQGCTTLHQLGFEQPVLTCRRKGTERFVPLERNEMQWALVPQSKSEEG